MFLVKHIIVIMCAKNIKVNLHLLKLFKKKCRLFFFRTLCIYGKQCVLEYILGALAYISNTDVHI